MGISATIFVVLIVPEIWKNSLEIMKLLSQLNAEGTTIVMVTHSQHDATYADRIINLFDGQIVDELEGKL